MLHFDISGMGGASAQDGTSLEDVVAQARRVEDLGFDGLWGSDHQYSLVDPFQPQLDRFIVIAALAAVTTRLRLGTLVIGNTYRHPVILAKLATTVDIVTGGRLNLGIGTGWTEPEHRAYGFPFPRFAERAARLDETLSILRMLWTQRVSTFEGEYYRLEEAPFEPKPVQHPYPPITVGGNSTRMLRIAARHADEWNAGMGSPAFLEGRARELDERCREIGRDPASISRATIVEVHITDDEAELVRLREAYLDRELARIKARRGQRGNWVAPNENLEDALWDMVLYGPPDRVIQGIRRLSGLGFTRFVFGCENDDTMHRLAHEVVPVLRTGVAVPA